MYWDILAYGNADSLGWLFNGIAALFQSTTWAQATGVALAVGFLGAIIVYALTPAKSHGWKWLATITILYSVVVVPKATVQVVDKLGGTPPRVVANVPLGLAALASISSKVGNGLTEAFEATFQVIPGTSGPVLPEELAYTKNGVMFGNRLVRATREVNFVDPNFRTDIINFIANCTLYDLGSHIPLDEFYKSNDVWSMMSSPNPARFVGIYTPTGKFNIMPCTEAYQKLNQAMPEKVRQSKTLLATAMNVALDPSLAGTRIDAQVERAYTTLKIMQAGRSAADLVRQNALINAVKDSHDVVSQRINDPAAMMMAQGRAQGVATANMSFIAQAKTADEALPMIRNSVEAILFVLFPFVVLMMLVYGVIQSYKMIVMYALALLWVQFWPPLYAVISFMGTMASAKNLAAAASTGYGENALSMLTASQIYSTSLSDSAIVGHVLLSVPLIAAAAVWGVDKLVGMGMGILASINRPMDMSSAGASGGNVNLGNQSFDQQMGAPMLKTPFMSQEAGPMGTSTSGIGPYAGVERYQALTSSLATSFKFNEQEASKYASSSRDSEAVSMRESEAAASSTSAALTEAMGMQQQYAKGGDMTSGTAVSSGASENKQLNSMMQIAKDVNRQLGVDENSTVGREVVGNALLGAKLSASFSGKAMSNEAIKDAYGFAQRALSQAGISDAKSVMSEFRNSDAYSWSSRSTSSGTSTFDSSYSQSQQHSRASEKAFQESREQARVAEFMRQMSSGVETDASNYVASHLKRMGQLEAFQEMTPQKQHDLVMGLAKSYGQTGQMPSDGSVHPGPNMNMREQFSSSSIAGSASTVGDWSSSNNASMRARQGTAGVAPGTNLVNGVGAAASAGQARIGGAIDNGTDRVVQEHGKSIDQYNQRADIGKTSPHHFKGGGDNTVRNVVSPVVGEHPQKQTGPTIPERSSQGGKLPEGSLADQIPK